MPKQAAPVQVALLTGLIVILQPAAAAMAHGGSGFESHVALGEREFVFARFNLTPDHDLRVEAILHACVQSNTRLATFGYVIADGVPRFHDFAPSQIAGLPPNSIGIVQAGGIHSELALGGNALCRPQLFGATNTRSAEQTLTFVASSSAEFGEAWINATWTRGVTSSEVGHGAAVIRYREEFDQGAGASIYHAPAGASALSKTSIVTARDTIGWFMPQSWDSMGASAWACSHNGVPCGEMDQHDLVPFASSGPTDWQFEIPFVAEAGTTSLSLAMIEFPGDDFVVD